jgi:hypothetical protein
MKKKVNTQLFNSIKTLTHVEMGACQGGNNSDKTYLDTKQDGKDKWDVGVDSLIDNIDSSKSLDKPDTKVVSELEYVDIY